MIVRYIFICYRTTVLYHFLWISDIHYLPLYIINIIIIIIFLWLMPSGYQLTCTNFSTVGDLGQRREGNVSPFGSILWCWVTKIFLVYPSFCHCTWSVYFTFIHRAFRNLDRLNLRIRQSILDPVMGSGQSGNDQSGESSRDRKNKKKSSLLVEDTRPQYQPPPPMPFAWVKKKYDCFIENFEIYILRTVVLQMFLGVFRYAKKKSEHVIWCS